MKKQHAQIAKSAAICIAILTCMASFSTAEVALQLPENFYTVAVNGKNSHLSKTVTLPNGENQIALRFEGLLGDSYFSNIDNQEMLESDTFVLRFSASDDTLTMTTNDVKIISDLKKFNNTPGFKLVLSNNESIYYDQDKLIKEGLQLMRNYEVELLYFNKTDSKAAVRSQETAMPPAPHAKKESASETMAQPPQQNQKHVITENSGNNNPVMQRATVQKEESPSTMDKDEQMAADMLRYWYLKASDQTRSDFKDWLKGQQ